jgi:adenine deaminase
MYSPPTELAAFIQSLPKTETHLHLEGCMPFELLQEAFPGRYTAPPAMWADDFRYGSFAEFMDMYRQWCAEFYVSTDRYYESARIMLARCRAQNVRYVETSFHLPVAAMTGLSPRDICRAVLAAAPDDMTVRVFVGMCHDDYRGATRDLIDDVTRWPELTGIDLHGPEDLPLEPWTAEVWSRARAAGKFNKAHAGEFMPPAYVARTLDELKVTRIEHGIAAAEDPALMARLVREGVTLDVCPISNVKLLARGLTSMKLHPLRRLFDAGVRVTVNSDDTFMFGNTLSEDYAAVAMDLGFTRRELAQLVRNGWEIALLPEATRKPFLNQLETVMATA